MKSTIWADSHYKRNIHMQQTTTALARAFWDQIHVKCAPAHNIKHPYGDVVNYSFSMKQLTPELIDTRNIYFGHKNDRFKHGSNDNKVWNRLAA